MVFIPVVLVVLVPGPFLVSGYQRKSRCGFTKMQSVIADDQPQVNGYLITMDSGGLLIVDPIFHPDLKLLD